MSSFEVAANVLLLFHHNPSSVLHPIFGNGRVQPSWNFDRESTDEKFEFVEPCIDLGKGELLESLRQEAAVGALFDGDEIHCFEARDVG